jgi:steroid delta-isomerase-like uncharacterized protein
MWDRGGTLFLNQFRSALTTPEVRRQNVSTEENKGLARRFYEIFNSGNFQELDKIMPANAVDHNPFPGQAPGLEGVKQALELFRHGFPDIKVTPEDIIAVGDKVVVRSVARGTNTGSFMGMPPTGKGIEIAAIDIYRVTDGKLAEAWHVEELLQLMMQIGAVPPPGGSGKGA